MELCPECECTFDSMTDLAHHECEPTHPTPQEVARIRAIGRRRSAEEQAAMIDRAWNTYGQE